MESAITNHKKSIVLAILLLATIIIPLAGEAQTIEIIKYSVSYDFFLGAKTPSPRLCLCSTIPDEIIIRNTGTFRAEYEVTTNIPEHAHIPFDTISLEPGREITIPITLSASCTDRERTQSYDVYVSNNFGTEKVIRRELSTQRCQSIEAELHADKNTTLPCEPVNYTLEIRNPAPFEEEYLVYVGTNKEFFSEEAHSLTLPPDRTGIITNKFLAACEVYGDLTNEFIIESTNNRMKASLSHNLTIEQFYDFETIIPGEIFVCEETVQKTLIHVTNTARIPNNYTLKTINAPRFIRIQDEHISLGAGENGTFYIEASPDRKQIGQYEFQATISTKIGDMETTRNVTLHVETCYEPTITLDAPDKACSGVKEYSATIKNTGTKPANFSAITYPETVSIPVSSVYLEPGQEANIPMTLSLPEDEKPTRKKTIGLTLVHEDQNLSWNKEKEIRIYNQHNCLLPEARPSRMRAREGTPNATITITNKGIETTSYALSLAGTGFIELEETFITLGPSESAQVTLLLYQEETNETTHFFTLSLEADNNVLYEKNLSLVLTGPPFHETLYKFLLQNLALIIALIILLMLIIIAILLIKKRKKKKKPKKTKPARIAAQETKKRYKRFLGPVTGHRLILLILILLVIIGVFIIYGFPEPSKPRIDRSIQEDPLHIAWYEGETHYVDLKDYFYDPDSDTLTFYVIEPPENIMAAIDNKTLVLMPEESWYGTTNITLIADDQRGGITESPHIKLEVVHVPERTRRETLTIYTPYIYALTILIILLILFFIPFRKKLIEKKKTGKKKQK